MPFEKNDYLCMRFFYYTGRPGTTQREMIDIEQLFKRYYRQLYVYAFQILQDEEKSKDMIADTFEYLCNHREQTDEQTINSLLYLTLRSRCLDQLRHDKVHQGYAEYYKKVTSLDAESHYEEYEERHRLVNDALGKLPERTRGMVEAFFVQRKKYKEIGEQFDITDQGVRKHIRKAVQMVRAEISKKI